jgi:hypothetical protein
MCRIKPLRRLHCCALAVCGFGEGERPGTVILSVLTPVVSETLIFLVARQITWGVGLSHERLDIAGAEGFTRSKATCAAPVCEVLTPAGVKGHITCKGIASKPGRSRVWPRCRMLRTASAGTIDC